MTLIDVNSETGNVPASPREAATRPRPALHFAPRRNWMNDPNGLIQWRGRTHLFYQHNPAGVRHENVAWGHASSADLVSWDDHPLALEPDPAGPDRDGCWSGCALVHDGRPHLLYTGVRGNAQLPCLATADDDDLIGWSRFAGNPVIAAPPTQERVVAFRDHTVWRAGDSWYQVVGGGLADRGGVLFLYRSQNLRDWRYLGIFAAADDHGLDGRIWECPDVFALGDTTVVVVSVLGGESEHVMWMTGELTGDRFIPAVSGRCDGGTRYYAPQSFFASDGRRIAFGWLRESLDELTGQDRTRVGAMSLPRELYLDGPMLRSRPASELIRARRRELANELVQTRGVQRLRLAARAAVATELRLSPERGPAGVTTVRLLGTDCEDVTIQIGGGHVSIREGGRELTAPATAHLPAPAAGEAVIYYDGGILEVYGPGTAPAAVICDRNGAYHAVEIQALPHPEQTCGPIPLRAAAWECE